MPSDDTRGDAESSVFACGDDLVGIELEDTRSCQALADQLRETGDWLESVAGIASCVAQFDSASIDLEEAKHRLSAAAGEVSSVAETETPPVEIPICYGGSYGPDLGNICEQLGLTRDEFIAMHTGREYRVDMLGFTPGFAFIGGLDDALNVPRRREPRVRLDAGSIGIAGGRTGIYTLAGPGGWQIVGRTPLKLFDATADDPFTLHAGTRVRFTAIVADEFELAIRK